MECKDCEYFEKEEGYCMAINCTPLNCDEPLPCEEVDAVTLYVERNKEDETLRRHNKNQRNRD